MSGPGLSDIRQGPRAASGQVGTGWIPGGLSLQPGPWMVTPSLECSSQVDLVSHRNTRQGLPSWTGQHTADPIDWSSREPIPFLRTLASLKPALQLRLTAASPPPSSLTVPRQAAPSGTVLAGRQERIHTRVTQLFTAGRSCVFGTAALMLPSRWAAADRHLYLTPTQGSLCSGRNHRALQLLVP